MRSSSEVWRGITALGIADDRTCRAWASEVASVLPPEELASGPKTIRALAAKGYVTAYQAEALNRDTADVELRAGRWTILEPMATPLWDNWFSASDAEGNGAWIRRVAADELEGLQPCQASEGRSLQLAKLASDRIQRVWPVEFAAGNLVAAVAPVEGDLLADVADTLAPSAKWQLFHSLVQATAELHRGGVVHGRIAPDRIVVEGDKCMLLIDPVCQRSAMPAMSSCGLIAPKLGSLLIEHFIAPEFVVPNPTPTMASDVYSLGCIWWWLLDGKPVANAATSESAMAAHTGTLPEFGQRMVASKNWSAEVAKCLQHALARNLDARFPDASKFLAALEAAGENAESKPAAARSPRKDRSNATSPKKKVAGSKKPVVEEVAKQKASSPQLETAGPRPEQNVEQETKRKELEPPRSAATQSGEMGNVSANLRPSAETASAAGTGTASSTPASPKSRRQRGKPNKWMLPVIGGSGFLIILLAVLKLSGALEFTATEHAEKPAAPYRPPVEKASAESANPVSSAAAQFNVVDSGADLWLPPAAATPVPVDLLPPGGQIFVSVRSAWLKPGLPVSDALGDRLQPLRTLLADYGGLQLDAWDQATLAFYPPASGGEFPQIAVRYQLKQPTDIDVLAKSWSGASTAIVDGKQFYASGDVLYYFRTSEDDTSITAFSCGPVARMQESVQLGGEAGPMTPPVEQLWQLSDSEADFSAFGAPQFLFTVGRELLDRSPPRMADVVRKLLATDRRAALLQTRFDPNWYVEAAAVGRSATSAAVIAEELRENIATWPQGVEQWFSDEAPHVAWRAIALRYPQMLRAASSQLRHGVEDGVAKANLYLPAAAAPNLILAVWLAAQRGATQFDGGASTRTPNAEPPLTVEQYLNRTIRLSFAQEPIEVALQLVADEANDSLPNGTLPMRFELDGDAFELAGITRNQQLRDFDHSGSTVREALTDIARRGNPVTTVTDTREEDQRLIWVVRPDPDSAERTMVSLTTRAAASARGDALTQEFAPAPQ